jgi:hypothetical protein
MVIIQNNTYKIKIEEIPRSKYLIINSLNIKLFTKGGVVFNGKFFMSLKQDKIWRSTI